MAQQIIITGNSASDGNGEPLRTAFTKINENFTELYSGNVQVTAANVLVYSVAGRTGNINLTVSDVAGAASVGYVNSAIAANISNYTGSVISDINSSISAANAAILDNTNRISTLETDVTTNNGQIAVLFNDKADTSFVVSSIESAVSTSIVALTADALNANITAANVKIDSLVANSVTQALAIDNLIANSATQSIDISSLLSNSATQATTLNQLSANAAFQESEILVLQTRTVSLQNNDAAIFSDISSLVSNSSAQSIEISDLRSNIIAANINITNLQSNASAQESKITIINANVSSLHTAVSLLNSNAATQDYLITLTNANIANLNSSVNSQLSVLSSNAASQSEDISYLMSNAAVQASLLSNISLAALEIDEFKIWSNANAATQAISLTNLSNDLTSNLSTIDSTLSNVNANIESINSNLNTVYGLFDQGNINISQLLDFTVYANSALSTKANISGDVFTGNITVPYLLANANIKLNGIVESCSEPSPHNYPNLAGIFVGNVPGYYQLVMQNVSTDANAASTIALTSDDGDDNNFYLSIGINNSNYYKTWHDTQFFEYPHDGYIECVGGNVAVRTLSNLYLAANSAVVSLTNDNYLNLVSANLRFFDNSVQTTAYIPNNLPYTMGNSQNWNSAVTTVGEALDQIAERLKSLGA